MGGVRTVAAPKELSKGGTWVRGAGGGGWRGAPGGDWRGAPGHARAGWGREELSSHLRSGVEARTNGGWYGTAPLGVVSAFFD